jgi:hypothetical protein
MKIELIFPCILIVVNFITSGIYFMNKDINRWLYWLFAGLITISVTFNFN